MFERTRSLSNASYSSKVNMLIDTDVDPESVIGSRPLMGHCVYESFVGLLLPLKLCVKFEWSIIKHCKIFKEV